MLSLSWIYKRLQLQPLMTKRAAGKRLIGGEIDRVTNDVRRCDDYSARAKYLGQASSSNKDDDDQFRQYPTHGPRGLLIISHLEHGPQSVRFHGICTCISATKVQRQLHAGSEVKLDARCSLLYYLDCLVPASETMFKRGWGAGHKNLIFVICRDIRL